MNVKYVHCKQNENFKIIYKIHLFFLSHLNFKKFALVNAIYYIFYNIVPIYLCSEKIIRVINNVPSFFNNIEIKHFLKG